MLMGVATFIENGITTMISAFGFPIVACVGLGYYVKHLIDRYTEFVEKSQERQSKAEQEMMTTVNNNTLALQRLCDKLGKEI